MIEVGVSECCSVFLRSQIRAVLSVPAVTSFFPSGLYTAVAASGLVPFQLTEWPLAPWPASQDPRCRPHSAVATGSGGFTVTNLLGSTALDLGNTRILGRPDRPGVAVQRAQHMAGGASQTLTVLSSLAVTTAALIGLKAALESGAVWPMSVVLL